MKPSAASRNRFRDESSSWIKCPAPPITTNSVAGEIDAKCPASSGSATASGFVGSAQTISDGDCERDVGVEERPIVP